MGQVFPLPYPCLILPICHSPATAGSLSSGSSFSPSRQVYSPVLLSLNFISSHQYGYHISALNQLQAVLTCQRFVPDSLYGLPTCIPMSDATFSFVTSMFTVGGLLGSLSANLATDRYGRKGASRISAMFNIAGAAISCLATSVAPMALGRFEFSPNLNKI